MRIIEGLLRAEQVAESCTNQMQAIAAIKYVDLMRRHCIPDDKKWVLIKDAMDFQRIIWNVELTWGIK